MKKYWLLSALLFAFVSPAHSALAKPKSSPTDTKTTPETADPEISPIYTLDGLTITPVRVPEDETREMLGASLWRYNVKVPRKGMDYKCTLEFRQQGKEPVVLDTRQGWPFHSAPYSLELIPLPAADSNWLTAQKIMMYTREGRGEEGLGGSALGGFNNPLKGLKAQGQSLDPLLRFSSHGEAVLMEFTVTTDKEPQKASLVWTVHILPHTDPAQK